MKRTGTIGRGEESKGEATQSSELGAESREEEKR
jgi:hypothetical protein